MEVPYAGSEVLEMDVEERSVASGTTGSQGQRSHYVLGVPPPPAEDWASPVADIASVDGGFGRRLAMLRGLVMKRVPVIRQTCLRGSDKSDDDGLIRMGHRRPERCRLVVPH